MDKKIREALEASRPGSQDLRPAELADVGRALQNSAEAREFQQRVAEWDVAIRGSIDDVPVPAGLAERLLAQLQAADKEAANKPAPPLLAGVAVASQVAAEQISAQDSSLTNSVALPRPQNPIPSGEEVSRRRWTATIGTAVAGSILAVLLGNWLIQGSELKFDELADQWREQLDDQWYDIARAPRGFSVPKVLLVRPTRWQVIRHESGREVVAYELVRDRALSAMLYVTRMRGSGVPTSPPVGPQLTVGNKAVAYWQSGGYVYVLVVPGSQGRYRVFVPRRTRPLAVDRSVATIATV